jgi:dihydrofolate reductase
LIISLIVAMDERGGIGLEGRLPWRLSADLRRFKSLTMDHHLIMGRKTYQTIGRILPGRTTIIVTRDLNYTAPGCPGKHCLIAHSLEEALTFAAERGENEVFIIGGGEIFNQSLELADRIYLTQIHAVVDADTHFPTLDEYQWRQVESSYQPADDKNQYPTTFKLLTRLLS